MGSRLDNPGHWIRRAESSLAMARARVRGAMEEEYCFNAQQAAEKAIKAVFVAHGFPFKFTHDLGGLTADLARRGVKVPAEIRGDAERLERITDYAVKIRYEEGAPTVSEGHRKTAVNIAVLTVKWAKAEVARAGKEKSGGKQTA